MWGGRRWHREEKKHTARKKSKVTGKAGRGGKILIKNISTRGEESRRGGREPPKKSKKGSFISNTGVVLLFTAIRGEKLKTRGGL